MFWATQAMFTVEQVAAGFVLLKNEMPLLKKVHSSQTLTMFVNIWLILVNICLVVMLTM